MSLAQGALVFLMRSRSSVSAPLASLQAGGGRGEAGSQIPQDVALETEGPGLGDPELLLRMAPQTGTCPGGLLRFKGPLLFPSAGYLPTGSWTRPSVWPGALELLHGQ